MWDNATALPLLVAWLALGDGGVAVGIAPNTTTREGFSASNVDLGAETTASYPASRTQSMSCIGSSRIECHGHLELPTHLIDLEARSGMAHEQQRHRGWGECFAQLSRQRSWNDRWTSGRAVWEILGA